MSSSQRRAVSQKIENSKTTKRSRIENSQTGRGEYSQTVRGECSQSLSQRSRADELTEEQLEAAVHKVIAFLLCEVRNKRKISKDDVKVNALNNSTRQYAEILKRAQVILSNIFGLQIAKIPDQKDKFIIVNKHRARFADLAVPLSTDGDVIDDTILTVVLVSIFMNRGQMYESHLMTILETIGFLNDKFYGSQCEDKMKDHVTELVKKSFVKQMYLDSQVVPRPQKAQNPALPDTEHVTLYRWGFRALIEVDLNHLVEYLKKMHNESYPPAFPKGYYDELKKQQQLLQSSLS